MKSQDRKALSHQADLLLKNNSIRKIRKSHKVKNRWLQIRKPLLKAK
jgi:hypothetical protein